MVSKKKKKKDNNIRSLIIFIGLFSVILVATVFNDIRVIKKNREETKAYNEKYQELLEEEASLNSEVIKLQDPEYVARYAREKFMYTKDGELILKIVDGEVLTSEEEKGTSNENKGEE
jgi:cell division protein DivIC